jgi:hypothetical protein
MTRIRAAALVCLAATCGLAVREASAQCPVQPTPSTPPLVTLTCQPESGDGTSYTTTCTLSGDLIWLYENSPGMVPYGACGAIYRFDSSTWQLCRTYPSILGEVIATYESTSEPIAAEFTFCNVPATDSHGAMILVALVAAIGAFILWVRRG